MTLDEATLRDYMGITSVSEISSTQVTGAITDATTLNVGTTTNETTLKFFAAYLLAKSIDWTKLKKSGDTEFQEQNPETYNDLYKMALSQESQVASSDGVTGIIVNSDPKFR